MPKATAAEITQRVDAIYELLLQCVGRRGIAQYAAQQGWAISSRQLDTYIARAKKLLAAQAEHERELELGRARGQLDLLFRKALVAEDRSEARIVLTERIALLGLSPASRHEISGPHGAPLGISIAERAAAFLAGLESQAEAASAQGRGEGDDG